jgi:hypothetical protein
MAGESWFVDGGWACHCGPVPPYPADYPGPCRQCFALAPVKQKIDPAQRVRVAEAAVLDRACKLQDIADATGVDMEDDLFAASWGSFSRAVLAYQETRGTDAN